MRSSDSPTRAGRRRVLYLVTADISAPFLRGQLAHLIEHGFDVHVATARSDPPAAFDDGVQVHDLPFEREPSLWADARALCATIGLVRRIRPDIVNASTPKAGMIGTLAAWTCRVPRRIYVVRGLRFETLSGLRRAALRQLERLTTSRATDVVYNSQSLLRLAELERAVRRGRGRVLGAGSGNGIDVHRFDDLPNGDRARAQLGIDRSASVVGYVGRLTRDKGIVDLVEAVRALPEPTVLLLVGSFESGDPVPPGTRRSIETSPDIIHVPWVDDPRSVYPAMDVLAFPSYREGLPNVPLEAQLCGIPVVAYRATGTVDAVRDHVGGRLVPLGSVAALTRELSELLNDDELRRHLGAQGRHDVTERFDRRRVWDALRTLLLEPPRDRRTSGWSEM